MRNHQHHRELVRICTPTSPAMRRDEQARQRRKRTIIQCGSDRLFWCKRVALHSLRVRLQPFVPGAFTLMSVVIRASRIDVVALVPGTRQWTLLPSQHKDVDLTLVDVEEVVDV